MTTSPFTASFTFCTLFTGMQCYSEKRNTTCVSMVETDPSIRGSPKGSSTWNLVLFGFSSDYLVAYRDFFKMSSIVLLRAPKT